MQNVNSVPQHYNDSNSRRFSNLVIGSYVLNVNNGLGGVLTMSLYSFIVTEELLGHAYFSITSTRVEAG